MTGIRNTISACLLACCCMLVTAPGIASNEKAMSLLQEAYAECKSAHVMRRKDFDLAKQTYARVIELKDQVTVIDPSVLLGGDPDVERILSYCETVGTDISRTEALPVFQEGANACSAAAEHIRNSDLRAAKKAYKRYLNQKEKAVAISDAILEVFSVTSEVRRCERVHDEIAEAESKISDINQQLQASVDYLNESLQQCQAIDVKTIFAGQSTQQVASKDTLQPLADGISGFKAELEKLEQRDSNVPNEAMLAQESYAVLDIVVAAEQVKKEIAVCKQEVTVAIVEAQAVLESTKTAIAESEKRAEQEALELALKEETPEQRQLRLQQNSSFYTLVKRVPPEFPEAAIRRGKSGYVVLEYAITPQGKVVNPKVIEANPSRIFDKAAIKAIKQWTYEADFADQEPDIAIVRTKVSFALN